MEQIDEALRLLGHRVKDKITGFEGIVSTIGFDLYGCIQAIVHPGTKKDNHGDLNDSHWFDVKRLEVLTKKPVMEQPDFVKVPGPEKKPPMREGLQRA